MTYRPRLDELLSRYSDIARALEVLELGDIHRVKSGGGWESWPRDKSAVLGALHAGQDEVRLQIKRLTARKP